MGSEELRTIDPEVVLHMLGYGISDETFIDAYQIFKDEGAEYEISELKQLAKIVDDRWGMDCFGAIERYEKKMEEEMKEEKEEG